MDPCNVYFIRLYKMVSEICKSVLWEMLTQMIHPPYEIICIVNEITIDSKHDKIPMTKNFNKLLNFWDEHNTTTPLETDFDITSLCNIIQFILRKQKSEPNILSTIKAINDIRNALAHAGSLSISRAHYKKKYREIRGHVDNLESIIDREYRPNFTCKGIRRRSSKYLNQIDRIHKEIIDPDTYMNLRRFINQWRKDLSVLGSEGNDKEQDKEKQKEGLETDLVEHVKDFTETTTCELEDNNKSDLYVKDNVEETINEVKDIIQTVEENKRDLNKQVSRNERETSKQKKKIKELEMSIINIQKEVTDTKAKIKADLGFEMSHTTESNQNTYGRDKKLTHKQKQEIEEMEKSTNLQITESETQFDEEITFCMDEYEELLTYQKTEKDTKIERVEEQYESEVTKHKSMFKRCSPKTFDQNKKKEKAEIEKHYQVLKAKLDRKSKDKISNDRIISKKRMRRQNIKKMTLFQP